jgi:putative membrane protein
MKLIRLSVSILVALVAILIAVDNRASVPFSLYPLLPPVEVPLFSVLFAGVLVGVLAGGGVVWWNGRRFRRAAREGRRETARLHGEVVALKTTPPAEAPR